jgi:cytochrome c
MIVEILSRLGGWKSAARLFAVFSFVCFQPSIAHSQQPAPVSPLLAAADKQAGGKISRRCRACHTLNKGGPHRLGPNLWNIVGRQKASTPRFRFSNAMKKLSGEWDFEALNAFLANPKKFVPGSRMAFAGLKNVQERANLIAYLRDLSDLPVPLPFLSTRQQRDEPKRDESIAPAEEFGGLPPSKGREEVFYLCGACHSLKLVTQQGLSRESWNDSLDWMTKKQGMPALEGAERALVLDYLAKEYGIPDRPRGFMPLLPSLMPLPPSAN